MRRLVLGEPGLLRELREVFAQVRLRQKQPVAAVGIAALGEHVEPAERSLIVAAVVSGLRILIEHRLRRGLDLVQHAAKRGERLRVVLRAQLRHRADRVDVLLRVEQLARADDFLPHGFVPGAEQPHVPGVDLRIVEAEVADGLLHGGVGVPILNREEAEHRAGDHHQRRGHNQDPAQSAPALRCERLQLRCTALRTDPCSVRHLRPALAANHVDPSYFRPTGGYLHPNLPGRLANRTFYQL